MKSSESAYDEVGKGELPDGDMALEGELLEIRSEGQHIMRGAGRFGQNLATLGVFSGDGRHCEVKLTRTTLPGLELNTRCGILSSPVDVNAYNMAF